jgi:hypothetical protein
MVLPALAGRCAWVNLSLLLPVLVVDIYRTLCGGASRQQGMMSHEKCRDVLGVSRQQSVTQVNLLDLSSKKDRRAS